MFELSSIPKISHTESEMFFLIAGPCAIESEGMAMEIGEKVKEITDRLRIPYIFKASYKKANRTRLDSFTGIGDEKALKILAKVGRELDLPVLTDVHTVEEVHEAAQYVDVLQIPAFLCRQTDLLVAAGSTGKIVNIKKGQFLSAGSMKYAMEKVSHNGNHQIMLTERGTTFGYSDLVVDFRNIVEMNEFGAKTVLDCTHSVQQPNSNSGVTGGKPHMIESLAKAGIAVGVDGIFIETHPDPSIAKSDGANMLPLEKLENLLNKLILVKKASLLT